MVNAKSFSLEKEKKCVFVAPCRFYSPSYSIAPNRIIAQTSISPYMHSPLSTYQVLFLFEGAILLICLICIFVVLLKGIVHPKTQNHNFLTFMSFQPKCKTAVK